ncbi:MAG: hypothetical protein IJT73_03105 [Selenomonadaceae bacterium]|nr:hypothetical protein [Selenomonadaceae bacterium]
MKNKNRRGNGWQRSKIRRRKLYKKYLNGNHKIWTTGVYFDTDKKQLRWFNNLWHRKFWRRNFNRRLRHKKFLPNFGGYKKIFYLVLNCDIVGLGYHGELKLARRPKIKLPRLKIFNKKIRPRQLRWFKIYQRSN